jgi:histidine kinase
MTVTSDPTNSDDTRRALELRSDRLRSLGEMAAGMAHELNQPLVGVRGLAEHLLIGLERGWDIPPERIREKLRHIVDQSDRMAHIIEHVRRFARDAGKPERRATSLNEVIQAARGLLGEQLHARGITLTLALAEGLPPVLVNPFSLEEVFINLLVNARDAVEVRRSAEPDTARAEIVLSSALVTQGDAVEVQACVEDSGAGIPAATLARVFEPFFTTKGPDRGTGLGLAISAAIVADHDGRIHIDSTPGHGTRVTVSLPALEARGKK